jgi:hypothetical protein
MFRFCAVTLSAGLFFAVSFGAQAASVEAEWAGAEVAVSSVETSQPSTSYWTEEQACDLAAAAEVVIARLEIDRALAPENFLDTSEDETFALITTDLAATAETTGSLQPAESLDVAKATTTALDDEVVPSDDSERADTAPLP